MAAGTGDAGAWGGERLRRKGDFRARFEVLLAVWGQAARGGELRVLTSESLGVKSRANGVTY